jgi:membrane associated rhomboid family serine protease
MQRRDVRFGLLLAIAGFVFQWVGQGYSASLPNWASGTLWALLAAMTIVYLFVRTKGLDAAAKQALADVENESKRNSNEARSK